MYVRTPVIAGKVPVLRGAASDARSRISTVSALLRKCEQTDVVPDAVALCDKLLTILGRAYPLFEHRLSP
jgi:hypothetical protein